MANADRITRVALPQQRWRLLVALVALALVTAACSDGDSTSPSSTTERRGSSTTASTTTASSTTKPTTTDASSTSVGRTVEDEIVARYLGYWDARFAANSGTPNPSDPALREYATGAQLDAVVVETQSNLDEGLAFRRAVAPADIQRVNVVEVDGDHAVVQECVVSDGVIVRRDSGEVVNEEVATHNVRGELLRVDGVWRVSSANLVQRWEGVAGCARAS